MPSPSIQSTVKNTFAGLKSRGLTEPVSFTLTEAVEASAYDPTTGEFTSPTTTTIDLDVVVVSKSRSISQATGSSPKDTLTILVDKADVGDLTSYDSLQYQGDDYSIESFDDNLYAVEIVLTKERA